MRHPLVILAGLLLGAAAGAAEPAAPAVPASEAQPAVETSPPAADPEVGRGNPRRQQVLPGEDASTSADGADGSGDGSAAPSAAPASGASAPAPSAGAPASGGTTPPPTGAPRGSADRIELEATQITGNAELPRVMYVVPWKRPELGELDGRPARSLLDEVLAPVDRDVFRRQNSYYEALRPDAAPEER